MEVKCSDPVFGEMNYRHRWYKKDTISLFSKEWNVTVAAKAYSGKPISDSQRDSYKQFVKQYGSYAEKIRSLITEYINKNCVGLAATWSGARMVKNAEDLIGIVRPTSVLFKQDGSVIVLFDCVWDEEHGIAVQIIPTFDIGSQDVFL